MEILSILWIFRGNSVSSLHPIVALSLRRGQVRWSTPLKGHPRVGEWEHWRMRSSGPRALHLALWAECARIASTSVTSTRLLHRGVGLVGPCPGALGRNPAPHHCPSCLGSFVQCPTPFLQEKSALPPASLCEASFLKQHLGM